MSGLVKQQPIVRVLGELHDVTPEEWRRRLLGLSEPVRYPAARIVWWEFFSLRMSNERWPHLDDMLARHDLVADEVLAAALIALGFPPAAAHRRASQRSDKAPKHGHGAARRRRFEFVRRAKGRREE